MGDDHQVDVCIEEGGPTPYNASSNPVCCTVGDNPQGGCVYTGGRTDPLITHPVIQYALLWGIIHQVDVIIKEGGPTPYNASSNPKEVSLFVINIYSTVLIQHDVLLLRKKSKNEGKM